MRKVPRAFLDKVLAVTSRSHAPTVALVRKLKLLKLLAQDATLLLDLWLQLTRWQVASWLARTCVFTFLLTTAITQKELTIQTSFSIDEIVHTQPVGFHKLSICKLVFFTHKLRVSASIVIICYRCDLVRRSLPSGHTRGLTLNELNVWALCTKLIKLPLIGIPLQVRVLLETQLDVRKLDPLATRPSGNWLFTLSFSQPRLVKLVDEVLVTAHCVCFLWCFLNGLIENIPLNWAH